MQKMDTRWLWCVSPSLLVVCSLSCLATWLSLLCMWSLSFWFAMWSSLLPDLFTAEPALAQAAAAELV